MIRIEQHLERPHNTAVVLVGKDGSRRVLSANPSRLLPRGLVAIRPEATGSVPAWIVPTGTCVDGFPIFKLSSKGGNHAA